jgi:hypothetical protein
VDARRAVRIVAGLVGVGLVGFGLWAFVGPASFYDAVATFPPYNEHFVHDLGAFQVGLGSILLLALAWTDGLLAALAGNAVGAVLHAIGHVIDRDLGGRAIDPYSLGLLAVILVLAALSRARRSGG